MSKLMKDELRKAGFKVSEEKKGEEKMGKKNPNKSRDKKKQNPEEEFEQNLQVAFDPNFVDYILNPDKPDYNSYVDKVKGYVEKSARKITTHQLRNIFSRIKGVKEVEKLWVLRPQLAYISGRAERASKTQELVYLLDRLIVGLKRNDAQVEQKLEAFKDFFEAIIAYHKYYESRKKEG